METEIVFKNESGVAVTTSYLVAEVFGKNHKRVLEDIDRLSCSDEFRKPNFGLSLKTRDLPNGGCKNERYYIITKDGFTILAMGYTGKKAMAFKEKYIAAFNAMEDRLRSGFIPAIENLSRRQILQMAIEAEEERERVEARLAMSEENNRNIQTVMNEVFARLDALEKTAVKKPVAKPKISRDEPKEVFEKIGLSAVQRASLFETRQIRFQHRQYITVRDAIKKYASKKLKVNKSIVFGFLRSHGYISRNPYTYNCPTDESIQKGWMIIVHSGCHKDRPNCFKSYTPYLSPAFVEFLERLLREEIEKCGNESDLFTANGKEDGV